MRVLDLPFGQFELFPNVIIARIHEGIHFDIAANNLLFEHTISHYGTEHKIAYISIRDNDYSVDPLVYLDNQQIPNLSCIGIVERTKEKLSTVAVESKFYKPNKLKAFSSEEDALIWANFEISNSIDEDFKKIQLNESIKKHGLQKNSSKITRAYNNKLEKLPFSPCSKVIIY